MGYSLGWKKPTDPITFGPNFQRDIQVYFHPENPHQKHLAILVPTIRRWMAKGDSFTGRLPKCQGGGGGSAQRHGKGVEGGQFSDEGGI